MLYVRGRGLRVRSAVLVKVLRVDWLVRHWSSYASTLESYLAHPASTVRQSGTYVSIPDSL